MNTTFKILWFEDEVFWYNMEKLQVDLILKEHNLASDYNRKDGADFDLTELKSNNYDLILMDYKLAENVTGDIIVSAIREADILTDILFYSSQEQDMLDAIRDKIPPIDGFYLTKRDNQIFTQKVEKIINKIVRRSEDVVNLRGFVLDNSSDFELRIKEIMNICWQKFNNNERLILTKALFKTLDAKPKWINSQVNKAKTQDDVFAYANNDDHLLSISDKLDIFQAIIPILAEAYNLSDLECELDFKQYYIDKVNVYRNKLGHMKLGEETIRIKGVDVKIDQDLHRTLRKNIANVDSLIKRIEEYVTTKI